MTQTGQIRYETRIIINVKVDYLPKSLLQSKDCIDECRNILDVNIINEKALSIKSQYLVGTSYTFLVELEFGRNHMSIFDVEIRIKTNLKKYF